MQALDSDLSLPLFQSSHVINTNPILDKNIQLINSMLELNYIKHGSEGLQFTNAGIEYMMKKFQEFCSNIEKQNIDLTIVYALNGSNPHKRKHGVNMLKEFKKNNLLIPNDSDDVNYNNVTFKKEYDAMELGVDGI